MKGKLIVINLFLLALSVNSQTYTWIGDGGDWFTASNWDSGIVPNSASVNVVIPNGTCDYYFDDTCRIIINSPVTIGSLEIGLSAALEIRSDLSCGNILVSGLLYVIGSTVSPSSSTDIIAQTSIASDLWLSGAEIQHPITWKTAIYVTGYCSMTNVSLQPEGDLYYEEFGLEDQGISGKFPDVSQGFSSVTITGDLNCLIGVVFTNVTVNTYSNVVLNDEFYLSSAQLNILGTSTVTLLSTTGDTNIDGDGILINNGTISVSGDVNPRIFTEFRNYGTLNITSAQFRVEGPFTHFGPIFGEDIFVSNTTVYLLNSIRNFTFSRCYISILSPITITDTQIDESIVTSTANVIIDGIVSVYYTSFNTTNRLLIKKNATLFNEGGMNWYTKDFRIGGVNINDAGQFKSVGPLILRPNSRFYIENRLDFINCDELRFLVYNFSSGSVVFDQQPGLINIDGNINVQYYNETELQNATVLLTIFSGIPIAYPVQSSIGNAIEVINTVKPNSILQHFCWNFSDGTGLVKSGINPSSSCGVANLTTVCRNTPIRPYITDYKLGQCSGRRIVTNPYGVISDHVGNGGYLRNSFCEWQFFVPNANNYTFRFVAYQVYGTVLFGSETIRTDYFSDPNMWDYKASVDPIIRYKEVLGKRFDINSSTTLLNFSSIVPPANIPFPESIDSLSGFTLFYYTNDSPPPMCSSEVLDLTKFTSYHVYPFLQQYFSGPNETVCKWKVTHKSVLPFGLSVKFFQPFSAISFNDYTKKSGFGGELKITRTSYGFTEVLAVYNQNTSYDPSTKASATIVRGVTEQNAFYTWEKNSFDMNYGDVIDITFTIPPNTRSDGFDIEFYAAGETCKGVKYLSIDSYVNHQWILSNQVDQASSVLKAGTSCTWKISSRTTVYIYFEEISTASDVIRITANTAEKSINKLIVGQGASLPSLEVIRPPLTGDGYITITYTATNGGGRGFKILVASLSGIEQQLDAEVLSPNKNSLDLNYTNILEDKYYFYEQGSTNLNVLITGRSTDVVYYGAGNLPIINDADYNTKNNIDGAILVKMKSKYPYPGEYHTKMSISSSTDYRFSPLKNRNLATLNGTDYYAFIEGNSVVVYDDDNYNFKNHTIDLLDFKTIKTIYALEFVGTPLNYRIMLSTEKSDASTFLYFFAPVSTSTMHFDNNFVAKSAGLSPDIMYLEAYSFPDTGFFTDQYGQFDFSVYLDFFPKPTYFLKRIIRETNTFYIHCNVVDATEFDEDYPEESLYVLNISTRSPDYDLVSVREFYDIPCWSDQKMEFAISNDWNYLAIGVKNETNHYVLLTGLFNNGSGVQDIMIPPQDPLFGYQIFFSYNSTQLIITGTKIYIYDLDTLSQNKTDPVTYYPNRYVYPNISFYNSNPFEIAVGKSNIYVLFDQPNTPNVRHLLYIDSADAGEMIAANVEGELLPMKCPPGTFKSSPGFHSCTFCPSGTYQPLSGQTSCTACNASAFCPVGSSFESYVKAQDSVIPNTSFPQFEVGESAGVDNAIWPALYNDYFGLAVLCVFLLIIALAIILITPILEDIVPKEKFKKFLRNWDADPMTYYDARDSEFKDKGSMKSTLVFTAKAILLTVSYIFMIYFYFQYAQYNPDVKSNYLNNQRTTVLQPLYVKQGNELLAHIGSQGFTITYYLHGSSFFTCDCSLLRAYSDGCKLADSDKSCYETPPVCKDYLNGTCQVQVVLPGM
eukprot:TRINITY_DN780_c0_g1_i4.p1 TRINITY_DN780_c0_g1~~TRINITY_DN780_c0_g1_i4.p1  ORF type:complete len:1703 (-),score=273.74 TRINITY_DN780_c0_g1_i4:997-6105(-)